MPPQPPPPFEPTLDERHDRIVANLTQRLARRARRPAGFATPHDFLMPLLDPELVPPGTGPMQPPLGLEPSSG